LRHVPQVVVNRIPKLATCIDRAQLIYALDRVWPARIPSAVQNGNAGPGEALKTANPEVVYGHEKGALPQGSAP
jgi:hypothetical protein